MSKHTQEPWRIDDERDTYTKGLHICGDADDESNGCGIAGIWIDGELDHDTQRENARRIVACVNACAGSTDEQLKLIGDLGGIHAATILRCREVTELEQQLDGLLVAAVKARSALAHADSKAPGLYGGAYAELDKAIAKARGQHDRKE